MNYNILCTHICKQFSKPFHQKFKICPLTSEPYFCSIQCLCVNVPQAWSLSFSLLPKACHKILQLANILFVAEGPPGVPTPVQHLFNSPVEGHCHGPYSIIGGRGIFTPHQVWVIHPCSECFPELFTVYTSNACFQNWVCIQVTWPKGRAESFL